MNSEELAKECRKKVLQITYKNKSQHIGSIYSIVDILSVLYSGVMKLNLYNLNDINRDYFILSKGHAGLGLYVILDLIGISNNISNQYLKNGTNYSGHISSKNCGIQVTTGALGYGLGISCGIAYSLKNDKLDNKVYCLIGDGECDEGAIWQSAKIAVDNNLNNIVVILDYNKLQALGECKDNFVLKWKSFGWEVSEIDGHNHEAIRKSLFKQYESPHCIIANTIKGRGVTFMENDLKWHYSPPNGKEYKEALRQLQ